MTSTKKELMATETRGEIARPVLLVHGIWDSAERLAPLRRGLAARGFAALHPIDLKPNTGSAPLEKLAAQVDEAARAAAERSPDGKIDVVGFSMGALVSRHWVQRAGRDKARVFVSISGPHHGTLGAWALPALQGVKQMRPGSDFIKNLAADPDPWGSTEVHCLYTPFDLMIVPATSSVLPGARSVRSFPVPLHRLMLSDPRVLDAVAAALRG